MATRQTKQALCCLTIGGINEFIMPASAGMKVAQLLQTAQRTNRSYEGRGDYTYTLQGNVEVQWSSVMHNQVRAPLAEPEDKPGRTKRVALPGLPLPEAP